MQYSGHIHTRKVFIVYLKFSISSGYSRYTRKTTHQYRELTRMLVYLYVGSDVGWGVSPQELTIWPALTWIYDSTLLICMILIYQPEVSIRNTPQTTIPQDPSRSRCRSARGEEGSCPPLRPLNEFTDHTSLKMNSQPKITNTGGSEGACVQQAREALSLAS